MYRGTTPTLYLELETELDLSGVSEMWVTLKSPSVEITKYFSKGEVVLDNEKKEITVALSQEETLKMYTGEVEVQVRFRIGDENGLAYATDTATVDIQKVLKDGVI